jgi:hypothetical protein
MGFSLLLFKKEDFTGMLGGMGIGVGFAGDIVRLLPGKY